MSSGKKKKKGKYNTNGNNKKGKKKNNAGGTSKYVVKKTNNKNNVKKSKVVKKKVSPPEPVVEEIPLIDPWKTLESPYGGKASPADQYNELLKNIDYWFRIDNNNNNNNNNVANNKNTNILSSGMFFYLWTTAEEHEVKRLKLAADLAASEMEKAKKVEEEENEKLEQLNLNDEGGINNRINNNTNVIVEDKNEDPNNKNNKNNDINNNKYVVMDNNNNISTDIGTSVDLEQALLRKQRISYQSSDISEIIMNRNMQNQIIALNITDNCFTSPSINKINGVFLREIIAAGNKILDFPDLSHLPLLLVLDLSYNPFKQFNENTKKTFATCKHLRILRLEQCELGSMDASDGGGLIDHMSTLLNTLEELNIGNNDIKMRKTMEDMKKCKRVKSLCIYGNPCTLKSAAENGNPDLTDVDTEWCLKLAMKFGSLKKFNHYEYSHSMKTLSNKQFSSNDNDAIGATSGAGDDSANCSCIEGNPCAVPYNCKNWPKRFEISRKARENKEIRGM